MTTRSFSDNPLPHTLIFAGALPFIAGALLLLAGINTLPLAGSVMDAMAAYGLVIVIFLTGIHWGQQLSLGKAAAGLFISSNVIAVMVWLCWIFLSPRIFMAVLTVPLTVLLFIDLMLNRNNVIGHDYFRSRLIITTVVITSLILAAAAAA